MQVCFFPDLHLCDGIYRTGTILGGKSELGPTYTGPQRICSGCTKTKCSLQFLPQAVEKFKGQRCAYARFRLRVIGIYIIF
jgi:hypothetical protein